MFDKLAEKFARGKYLEIDLTKMNRVYPFHHLYNGSTTPAGLVRDGKYSINQNGELVIIAEGAEDWSWIGLQTNEAFKMPVRIDFTAKTNFDMWLHFYHGSLALNYNWDCPHRIHVGDIYNDICTVYENIKLPLDDFAGITWYIDKDMTMIYCNGEHILTHQWVGNNLPDEERANIMSPMDITAGCNSTVIVKSIKVTSS